MHLMRTRCRTRRQGATDIAQFAFVDDGLHLLFDVIPRAHVFRLFLNPIQFGILRITPQHIVQTLQWEGIKLFHANQRHIIAVQFFALVEQIIVDLAARQQNALDLIAQMLRIANHFLERAARQIFQARCRLGITEQELRSKHYQRFTDPAPVFAAVHLTP